MEKNLRDVEERRRLNIPDRRKNTYATLEAKVDEYFDEVEARLSRFFAKALFIFVVIGLTSAIALAGFGILLSEQRDTNNKLKAACTQEVNADVKAK